MCRAQELGSYAQGQGHNQVKGQIVPKIVLLINYWSKFDKLHRKIEHNEEVCRAQELGSYAQGQGHNQVKGQIGPKIVLLINYWSKFDKTSQKDKE